MERRNNLKLKKKYVNRNEKRERGQEGLVYHE